MSFHTASADCGRNPLHSWWAQTPGLSVPGFAAFHAWPRASRRTTWQASSYLLSSDPYPCSWISPAHRTVIANSILASRPCRELSGCPLRGSRRNRCPASASGPTADATEERHFESERPTGLLRKESCAPGTSNELRRFQEVRKAGAVKQLGAEPLEHCEADVGAI